MGKVEEQEERIARLEAELGALRGRLEAVESAARPETRGRHCSMKDTACCPGCGGSKILHAREVLDRSEAGRSRMALAQPSMWRDKGVGEFELYVCTACGLCEWRVKDLSGLEIDGDKFRLVEGAPVPNEPYR
jgi:hypothetical protein